MQRLRISLVLLLPALAACGFGDTTEADGSPPAILITKPDLALLRNAFQLREVLEIPAIRHMAGAMPREELLTIEAVHQELLDRTPGVDVVPSAEHLEV